MVVTLISACFLESVRETTHWEGTEVEEEEEEEEEQYERVQKTYCMPQ